MGSLKRAAALALILLTAGCFKVPSPPTAPDPPMTPTTPTPTPPAPPPIGPGNAHRVIAWASYEKLIKLTDADLDMWKSRGVDGFVVQTRYLDEIGGLEMWTGDPNAPLSGVIIEGADVHEKQRTLRDTRFTQRCHDRGIQVYLGFYLSNYHNLQTPLKVWNDEAGWTQIAGLAKDIAGAAKLLGMDGLATDSEMYRDDTRQTWNWDYPGNAQSESVTRTLAKQRGRQFMDAILAGFPNVEIINYRIEIPGSWEERVQSQVNKIEGVWNKSMFVDFWGGMADAGGFHAIYFLDPIFYKSWHIRSGWDEALQYNREGVRKTLSERWSNWSYASSRFFITPFAWIDPGPSASEFDDARSPEHVAAQLDAFHRWGEGRTFGLYTQHIDDFDYTPYVPALQRASTPDAGATRATVADVWRMAVDIFRRPEAPAPTTAPRVTLETIGEGITDATDIAFSPDGSIFVAERGGAIRILNGGGAGLAATIADVSTGHGNGLLAIALDPDFARTRIVYALYTTGTSTGRPSFALARFREVQGTLGERAVLLANVAAPAAGASAVLRFGPDGRLYAALGSNDDPRRAADAASLNGKVLRLNADGTTPDGQRSPIYAYGFASPRGIDWHPSTGTLWIAGVDARRQGMLAPGVEGERPLTLPSPPGSIAFEAAASGGWPVGSLFVAGGDQQSITRLQLGGRFATQVAGAETIIANAGGRITAITAAPDGAIYFAVNGVVAKLVRR